MIFLRFEMLTPYLPTAMFVLKDKKFIMINNTIRIYPFDTNTLEKWKLTWVNQKLNNQYLFTKNKLHFLKYENNNDFY